MEVFPACLDKFRVEARSLQFAKVVFERHFTTGTDLHGLQSLVVSSCIMERHT